MKNILDGNGEIDLLINSNRVTATDELEQWKIDELLSPNLMDSLSYSSNCFMEIDFIVTEWLHNLTAKDWVKIKRQRSLFGIPLPDKWIKVWRFIIKEPTLRDPDRASKNGRNIGTYSHLWNIWSKDLIDKYANQIDKELIEMVDGGYLYSEIGERLLIKYGDEFWKPRKANSKTTPAQVVNNYLYWKIPNKIVRSDLTALCLNKLKNLEKLQLKRNNK